MRRNEQRACAPSVAIALVALVFQNGCWTKTANEVMSPDPTPESGFLVNPEEMRDTGGKAFQRGWRKPGFWFDQYQSVRVAPVNVAHLLEMSGWQEASLQRDDVEVEATKLGVEMQEKFAQALRDYPGGRLQVVDESSSAPDLVLELALVQVVPSKAWLGTVGVAAWALGPLGIPLGVGAATANQASLAFEGRVRDAGSGEVVGKFADNEPAKTRPLNLEAMTWYGHCHEIIDTWAEQFAAVANGPSDVQVEDDSFFSLKPW